eukprot:NODE_119_length_18895_cov_0.454990.p2 type:complete len:925 gc:universal NODE_119_length_18895_cov_0.454990:16893-14119(-)
MVFKLSVLHLLAASAYAISVDCPDVINLAVGLNMGVSNPGVMRSLRIDCCTSDGVSCVSERVESIRWRRLRLTGSINMTALPRMMTYLDLSYNKLTGYVPGDLPPTLTWTNIGSNMINGGFPNISISNLEYFRAENNKFTGPIPVLPNTMVYIYVSYNMLSGCIPEPLPPSISAFEANSNRLNCPIPATLPASLHSLKLESNRINGTIPATLPANLYTLTLGWNDISGMIPYLPNRMDSVGLQSTAISGTLHLNSAWYLYISNAPLSSVVIDDPYFFYCDLTNTDLSNPADDPQLAGCDRSAKVPSTISDCDDVVNLAYGLNLHISFPDLMQELEYNCCTTTHGHITCNSTNVIEIRFNDMSLDGTINGTAAPRSLQKLNLFYNQISGPIPNNLPDSLLSLDLRTNRLSGPLPAAFPLSLNTIYVNENFLNGSIPAALPVNMEVFCVSNNYLEGSLPTSLPSTLLDFEVDNNYLTGGLPAFPDGLKYLYLNDNKFTGQVLLNKPNYVQVDHNYITNVTIKDSSVMYYCDISNNPLLAQKDDADLTECFKYDLYIVDCVGVIGLATGLNLDVVQPALMISIETDCCSSAGVTCAAGRVDRIEWPNMSLDGTIDTRYIPSNLTALDLSRNSITGPVPTALPDSLQSLLLNKNKLSGSLPSSIPSGLVSLDVSNNNLSGPVPNLSSIEYIYLNRDVPPFNQFTGSISVLKPKELYVPNNLITNILISETQQLMICNISNNPLLAHINDASLSSCIKDGLYNQSTAPPLIGTLDLSATSDYKESLQSVSTSILTTSLGKLKTSTTAASIDAVSMVDESLESILRSRFLRTRPIQQSATGTAQYYTAGSDVTYVSTLQSAFTSYNTGKYTFSIHWTLFVIGKCVLSIMVAIAVLYYTPLTRAVRGWIKNKDKSSKKTKDSKDKAFGSML